MATFNDTDTITVIDPTVEGAAVDVAALGYVLVDPTTLRFPVTEMGPVPDREFNAGELLVHSSRNRMMSPMTPEDIEAAWGPL